MAPWLSLLQRLNLAEHTRPVERLGLVRRKREALRARASMSPLDRKQCDARRVAFGFGVKSLNQQNV